MRRAMPWWTLGVACGLLVGCFDAPAAAVMFSCDPESAPSCPDGYACEADGCCHRNGSDVAAHLGECKLQGGTDGATTMLPVTSSDSTGTTDSSTTTTTTDASSSGDGSTSTTSTESGSTGATGESTAAESSESTGGASSESTGGGSTGAGSSDGGTTMG